jgi:DNA-binding LacI/PurR family transcriptional regulator
MSQGSDVGQREGSEASGEEILSRIDVYRELSFNRTIPLQRQITDSMRDLIRRGTLEEGTKIPSIQTLAKLWNTTHFTVNRALKPLMEEGLLERKRRIGTTVRHVPKTRTIGIYLAHRHLFERGRFFYLVLYVKLEALLGEAGYRTLLWIDTRPDSERGEAPNDLRRAIDQRDLLGLISPLIRRDEVPWMRRLSIPVVGLSNVEEYGTNVGSDYDQMLREFCEGLRAQGCRTVGLLVPFSRETNLRGGYHSTWYQFYESFDRAIARVGLTAPSEWVWSHCSHDDHGSYAYHRLMRMSGEKKIPDGLIVYPDTMVEGVLQAIWKLGLRVPKDVKLGLHCNEDLQVSCPFPAMWAETSVTGIAQALIDQLYARIQGRVAPVRVTLPFRVFQGPSFPLTDEKAAWVPNRDSPDP